MSGQIKNILSRYEEDINQHDCEQWEKQLSEEPSLAIIDQVANRKTRRKMELLDVDLVRGSTFPKSKQKHDFKSILLFSLMSIIFFPFRSTWWIRKTSYPCYLLGCLVYTSSLLNLYWYHTYLCRDQEQHQTCDHVTPHEVYEPIILFFVLAFLQCQIVSPLRFKNLDFFEQQPMTRASSNGIGTSQYKRQSVTDQRKISSADKITSQPPSRQTSERRKSEHIRKPSIRPAAHPCDMLDSWHENSSSGSGSDNDQPGDTGDRSAAEQSGSGETRARDTHSSEEREYEQSEPENIPSKRKLSKQKLLAKDSEVLSSSNEDKNNKQSSPIILKIGNVS